MGSGALENFGGNITEGLMTLKIGAYLLAVSVKDPAPRTLFLKCIALILHSFLPQAGARTAGASCRCVVCGLWVRHTCTPQPLNWVYPMGNALPCRVSPCDSLCQVVAPKARTCCIVPRVLLGVVSNLSEDRLHVPRMYLTILHSTPGGILTVYVVIHVIFCGKCV